MNPRHLLVAFALLALATPAAEARGPFSGNYSGECTRTAANGAPKKKKLRARAVVRQNGPTDFDSLATVTATGSGGEKLEIKLDLDALNNGTLTVNGTVVAGPAPRTRGVVPKSRPVRFRLNSRGKATFVGPLKQTLAFSGRFSGAPFRATGTLDLGPSSNLILDVNITFSKPTALGRTLKLSFRGQRQ